MARKMGMLTVAEGVETQEQLQILQDIGCDFAQGFVLSKPLPAKEYERSMLGKSLY
jgi:EAL domain-containing protein (putative c-di-GMP-specific phosphodiesterase class I)